MTNLKELQKDAVLLPKRPAVEKHRTNDKCDGCGSSNLAFRRYGMVDNEGRIHSGWSDWYRCLDCHFWVLAYPIDEGGRI